MSQSNETETQLEQTTSQEPTSISINPNPQNDNLAPLVLPHDEKHEIIIEKEHLKIPPEIKNQDSKNELKSQNGRSELELVQHNGQNLKQPEEINSQLIQTNQKTDTEPTVIEPFSEEPATRGRNITLDLNKIFTTEVAELDDFIKAYQNKSTVFPQTKKEDRKTKHSTEMPIIINEPQIPENTNELRNQSVYIPLENVYNNVYEELSHVKKQSNKYPTNSCSEYFPQNAFAKFSKEYQESTKREKSKSPIILERLNNNSRRFEENQNNPIYENNNRHQSTLLNRLNQKMQDKPDPIVEKTANKLEEKPIIVNKKTFEQLLEEELNKEDNLEDPLGGQSNKLENGAEEFKARKTKQTFLRKHEGKNLANLIAVVAKVDKDKKETHVEVKEEGRGKALTKNAANGKSKRNISQVHIPHFDFENDHAKETKTLLNEINYLFENFEREAEKMEDEIPKNLQKSSLGTEVNRDKITMGKQSDKYEDQMDEAFADLVLKTNSPENEKEIKSKLPDLFEKQNEVSQSEVPQKSALAFEGIRKIKANDFLQQAQQLIDKKMEELQNELNLYKTEILKLKQHNSEIEKKERELENDRQEFEKFKEEEIRRIKELKKEEVRKMQRDKQIALRNQKLAENKPTKKEKEEIESLRQEIKHLEDESAAKDKKQKIISEKQKKKMEEQIEEINEFKTKIERLEQQIIISQQISKKNQKAESKEVA